MSLPDPGSGDRTRIRRLPELAVADREIAYAVLDAGRVGHLGIVDDGQPYVLPIAYARRADEVLFHGSTGSRLFRALADGAPTCLSVTHLDGLVVALSAFESSMNYRSVMVLGRARRLPEHEELEALQALSDHLLPGRWADCRHPSAKERAATMVLALPLAECSVKVRSGDPDDGAEDAAAAAETGRWAGVVPVEQVLGRPVRSGTCSPVASTPAYLEGWTAR